MSGRLVRSLLVVILMGLVAASGVAAQSLGQQRAFGRYQQLTWQDLDGLPQNTVIAVTQTRDGYLWIGTYGGAARFDGVRFTHFTPTNTPGIGNAMVTSILETRGGELWLGTFGGGVSRRSGDRFTAHGVKQGLSSDYVKTMLEDRAGTIWIATDGGGVARYRDGVFSAYTTANGLPSDRVHALVEAADGSMLVGTTAGLARVVEGRVEPYGIPTLPTQLPIQALARDRDGALWIAPLHGGLYRLHDGVLADFGRAHGLTDALIESLYAADDGVVWAGSIWSGLFRYADGRFEQYAEQDGLPGVRVAAMARGPDGGLWAGTEGGLVRLKRPGFAVHSARTGVISDVTTSTLQDREDSVWLSSALGVTRVRGGVLDTFTVRQGLPRNHVRMMALGADGFPVFLTRDGLVRWAGRRFEPLIGSSEVPWTRVTTFVEDRTGALWIGIQDGGLMRVRDGKATRFTRRDGLADHSVLSLFEDRAGNLWVGTFGGVTRISGGRVTSWSVRDGLASDHVTAFHEDATGAIWIGTHGGGVSRLKNGRLATISTREGLADDFVFRILEDEAGNLWMNSNTGIWRTSLSQLNGVAEHTRARVESFAYGTLDGMQSSEGVGGTLSGWRMRDGTLWFPTIKGVVVVDPRRRDPAPPRLVIEGAVIDRQPASVAGGLTLVPGQENLEIQYTGLSWSRSQAIRFRYRLEGLDRDWVDAGSRRTAYYSHLPPGGYTFNVIADNGEGIWNEAGTTVAIVVQPRVHQTWWFRSGLVLIALGVIWATVHYRFGQVRRAQAAQQAFSRQLIDLQERERQRIAAELHDSLGQSLLVMKNRALIGEMTQPADPALTQFREISAAAAQTLEEVRAISYNLRPHHLEQLGLTTTIGAMIQKIDQSASVRVTGDVDDIDGLFPPSDEITIYRIIQESLNNVLKHAGATTAAVVVRSHEHEVDIVIRDDGRGFDPRDSRDARAGTGGFGLKGIAERVQMLGGTHTIESAAGLGTSVRVRIDLRQRTSA